jgi:hypothetical protein
MAFVLADRVQETSITTGTGTLTLAGAVSGYQSFSAVGNSNSTYYGIVNANGEWENGIGTYTSSGTTLSRTTVLSSSNSGNLVNFSAGTKNVFVNYPAGRAAAYDTETPSTGFFEISVGTTAQRPSSPASGMIRYNTSLNYPEWYDGTNSRWQNFFGVPVADFSADFLVIAGGGGGAGGVGGGGGAGGYRTSAGTSGGGGSAESALAIVTNTAYTITIGAGGAKGATSTTGGTSGLDSVFATITSTGGGGGGTNLTNGLSGGSGGGAGYNGTGGTRTVNQGFAGGNGAPGSTPNYGAAGGGGAGAVGVAGTTTTGGNGGAGVASTITGSSVTRAGGGGGGTYLGGTLGNGGTGGGGNAGASDAGDTNTGSGGGGAKNNTTDGGNGGSGVIIIKVADTRTATFSSGVTSSLSTAVAGFKIYTVTATSTTSETVTFT